MISFKEKLHNTIKAKNSNLCVGIDIDKKYFNSDVTIQELNATKNDVKGYTPAFDVAVKVRRDKNKKRFSLGKRTIAAVRKEFGGHVVKKD